MLWMLDGDQVKYAACSETADPWAYHLLYEVPEEVQKENIGKLEQSNYSGSSMCSIITERCICQKKEKCSLTCGCTCPVHFQKVRPYTNGEFGASVLICASKMKCSRR
jgi:hypothetical protein